jgi:hypothetical protein
VAMLLGLALALACAPAGVLQVHSILHVVINSGNHHSLIMLIPILIQFCDERDVYFREAACGHDRVAYFIGKRQTQTTHRILIDV